MFLFLAITAGLVTLYLVGRALMPLAERSNLTSEDWTRIEDESADLLAQRDRLVGALKDLELEAALNKIHGRDLTQLRARFESEALDVVRRLDERAAAYADRLGPAAAPPSPATEPSSDEVPAASPGEPS